MLQTAPELLHADKVACILQVNGGHAAEMVCSPCTTDCCHVLLPCGVQEDPGCDRRRGPILVGGEGQADAVGVVTKQSALGYMPVTVTSKQVCTRKSYKAVPWQQHSTPHKGATKTGMHLGMHVGTMHTPQGGCKQNRP